LEWEGWGVYATLNYCGNLRPSQKEADEGKKRAGKKNRWVALLVLENPQAKGGPGPAKIALTLSRERMQLDRLQGRETRVKVQRKKRKSVFKLPGETKRKGN